MIIRLPLKLQIINIQVQDHIRSVASKYPLIKVLANNIDRTAYVSALSLSFSKNSVPNCTLDVLGTANASLFPPDNNLIVELGYKINGVNNWFRVFTGKVGKREWAYSGTNGNRIKIINKGMTKTLETPYDPCNPGPPEQSGTVMVLQRIVTRTVRFYLGRVWIVWLTGDKPDENGNPTGEFARTGAWRYASQSEINSCKTANDRIEVRRGNLARLKVKLSDIVNSTGPYRNTVWELYEKETAIIGVQADIVNANTDLAIAESEGRDCSNVEEFNPWIDLSVFGNQEVPITVCDSLTAVLDGKQITVKFPGKCMQMNFNTMRQAIDHAKALAKEGEPCAPPNEDTDWWETPEGKFMVSSSGAFGGEVTYDGSIITALTLDKNSSVLEENNGSFEIAYDPYIGLKTKVTIYDTILGINESLLVNEYSIDYKGDAGKLKMRCRGKVL